MEQDKIRLEGVLHYWSETGTEGGYWAFQDKRFIKPPTPGHPHGQWSYDGLHVLKDGDHLTIFSSDHGGAVWSGKIKLKKYPSFKESVRTNGMWIHADQEGVKRETWAKWFLLEYPAILIKDKPAK